MSPLVKSERFTKITGEIISIRYIKTSLINDDSPTITELDNGDSGNATRLNTMFAIKTIIKRIFQLINSNLAPL